MFNWAELTALPIILFDMETITINNIDFCNFGENSYSGGMQLISCYPMPENMVKDVLDGKYPNVWLNPSAECGSEFYGLYGTKEQYENVYESQKSAQISKRVMDRLGWNLSSIPVDEYERVLEEENNNYQDWWNRN